MAGVINDLIREIVTEMGATAMTITHDMSSVRAIADRVAMLHAGVIRWTGPVAEMDTARTLTVPVHSRARRRPDRVRSLDPRTPVAGNAPATVNPAFTSRARRMGPIRTSLPCTDAEPRPHRVPLPALVLIPGTGVLSRCAPPG